MSRNVILIIVSIVGGVILLSCIGAIVVGSFLVSALAPPEDIDLDFTVPADVQVGESFEMALRIRNTHPNRAQSLETIDIDERLFRRLDITSTVPASREPYLLQWDNTMVYTFHDVSIPPDDEILVTFHATATQAGAVSSFMDVCINSPSSFLTEHFTLQIDDASP